MAKLSKRRSYARVGFSIKLIFEDLADAGSLTIGYTTFCYYTRGQGERRHGKKKTGPKPGLRQKSNQTESKPAPRIDKSTPFKLAKARLEDLI